MHDNYYNIDFILARLEHLMPRLLIQVFHT